jgi:hypothetical protein
MDTAADASVAALGAVGPSRGRANRGNAEDDGGGGDSRQNKRQRRGEGLREHTHPNKFPQTRPKLHSAAHAYLPCRMHPECVHAFCAW